MTNIECSNRLPVLAEEIKRAHTGVMDAAKTAAERAIEAGHALIEAKSLVKHRQWLPLRKRRARQFDRPIPGGAGHRYRATLTRLPGSARQGAVARVGHRHGGRRTRSTSRLEAV